MITLIISDIHCRWEKAQELISQIPNDQVIMLGDYWDQFNDSPEQNYLTAKWVKERLTDNKFVFLLGNHDTSYLFGGNLRCSGWTMEKATAINSVIEQKDVDSFQLFYRHKDILFSHAPIGRRFVKKHFIPWNEDQIPNLDNIVDWLTKQSQEAVYYAKCKVIHPLFEVGSARGGDVYNTGGIVWCDADVEYLNTKWNSICGHTPHPNPLFFVARPSNGYPEYLLPQKVNDAILGSRNWMLDLDTHTNHFSIINDDKLSVFKIDWDEKNIKIKATELLTTITV